MRRKETEAMRVFMKMNVEGKRERRKPKKRLFDTIENGMRATGICVEDVGNGDEWRSETRAADPK